MIRTVTLNPAIDQTVSLPRLEPGEVNRATDMRRDPGGKGVNVASCLADWGLEVAVHGLIGRDNPRIFERLLAAKGIHDALCRLPGETRTNIKILDTAGAEPGRTTDVNLPGFSAGEADVAAVAASLASVMAGEIVILSGSHPAGVAAEASARLAAGLIAQGARVILDVSGPALAAALAAPELPFAIKPNRQELEDWAGRPLADRAALAGAAADLVGRGIGLVAVSLGTGGAIFVTAAGGVQAAPVALSTGSTVGAGDAMVAGIAAALDEGLDLMALARQATAFAGAKLGLPGPNLPLPAEVRALAARVRVQVIDDWVAAGARPEAVAR